jgi:Pyridine nucleotide-disulphide oxidoreductase, dimerisation domain
MALGPEHRGRHVDRILGFTMIGAEAGEVVAAVQTEMLAGLPYPKLRDAVLANPTMAEGLDPLFSNVPPRSRDAAGHGAQATGVSPATRSRTPTVP